MKNALHMIVNEQRINLAETIGEEIKSRATVESVYHSILPLISAQARIIINFDKVKFISRAAAHQFLKLKALITQKGAFVTFENLKANNRDLLQKVAKSTKKNEDATMVYHLQFESEEELEDYLSKLE
jgi:anti-anti-sigma regulatory factor